MWLWSLPRQRRPEIAIFESMTSIEKSVRAMLNTQIRADKRAARAGEPVSEADKIHKETVQYFLEFLKASRKADEALDFKIKALGASRKPSEKAMRKSDEKFNRWLEQISRKGPNGHSK